MPLGFINRLKERWQGSGEPQERPRAGLPPGIRIYAIGDVHGRADLLERMAGLVERDLAEFPLPSTGQAADRSGGFHGADGGMRGIVSIFLGDYIDRGPDSAQVLERLAVGAWPTPIISLLGNHEVMAFDFLADPAILPVWRAVGGLATLASYGVDVSAAMSAQPSPEAIGALQQAFEARLPEHHRSFLKDRALRSFTIGDYFFCHAGVRPGVPLDRQDPFDLMTIRDPFLSSTADFGKIVVHGHTPHETPVFRSNRIGIDTGAYATGVLTALVLDNTSIRTLSTG
ncbi:metallophosphoesterase [Alsobacter sp. R-9]